MLEPSLASNSAFNKATREEHALGRDTQQDKPRGTNDSGRRHLSWHCRQTSNRRHVTVILLRSAVVPAEAGQACQNAAHRQQPQLLLPIRLSDYLVVPNISAEANW